jgi:hypothetical protein
MWHAIQHTENCEDFYGSYTVKDLGAHLGKVFYRNISMVFNEETNEQRSKRFEQGVYFPFAFQGVK